MSVLSSFYYLTTLCQLQEVEWKTWRFILNSIRNIAVMTYRILRAAVHQLRQDKHQNMRQKKQKLTSASWLRPVCGGFHNLIRFNCVPFFASCRRHRVLTVACLDACQCAANLKHYIGICLEVLEEAKPIYVMIILENVFCSIKQDSMYFLNVDRRTCWHEVVFYKTIKLLVQGVNFKENFCI
jgi:hypothetical protein